MICGNARNLKNSGKQQQEASFDPAASNQQFPVKLKAPETAFIFATNWICKHEQWYKYFARIDSI